MNEDVEKRLAEFIERREAGENPSVESFLAEHPEGGEELREALAAFARVEGMFPDTASLDDSPAAIGPYRVLGTLGRGGMGRVFRVEDPEQPGRTLALKQLHPMIAALPRALERFRREGFLLEKLDHPGVVRVHAVESETAAPYLVMDLVEGVSLASLLADARRRLDEGAALERALELPGDGPNHLRATRIALRLARAVEAVHDRGLLHRDLKPSNVILSADGQPVLIDFGLAVHDESATLTASGDLLGTPHYMAPEQARGERADPRTDVYGLAAVLYELLTLRPPHPGSDPFEVIQHILRRPIRDVTRANRTVPTTLSTVLRRALAWRRERRYPRARELADDLQAILDGRAPRARAPGWIEWSESLLRFHPRRVAALAAIVVGLALVPIFVRLAATDDTALRAVARREATLAWIEEDDGALAEALDRLEELGETAPRIRFWRAQLREESLEPTGSPTVDALARGIRSLEEDDAAAAAEAFALAAELSPDWALPVLLLGRAARETGDDDRAERELTAASRLLPGSVPLAIELAELHLDRDRHDEAKRVLDRRLGESPDDWRLWSKLAKAQLRRGEPEPAFEAVLRAMELAPRPDSSLLNRYGVIVDRLGNHEEARETFRKMISRRPKVAMLHFNLGYSYDLECRLVDAREAYRRAYELDPKTPRNLAALAHIAAGSNREQCERCRTALAETPDLLDIEEAERMVLEAIEFDRCETDWLADFAGTVVRRIGRHEAIAEALREAIDGAEVDERVVRVERVLRRIDGR